MVGLILTILVVGAAVVLFIQARLSARRSRHHGSYLPPLQGHHRSGYVPKPPTQWITGGERATPRQQAFLASRGIDASRLTKTQASIEIQRYLGD